MTDRNQRMAKFYEAVKTLRHIGSLSDRDTHSTVPRACAAVADALEALDDELAAVEAAARDSVVN